MDETTMWLIGLTILWISVWIALYTQKSVVDSHDKRIRELERGNRRIWTAVENHLKRKEEE